MVYKGDGVVKFARSVVIAIVITSVVGAQVKDNAAVMVVVFDCAMVAMFGVNDGGP